MRRKISLSLLLLPVLVAGAGSELRAMNNPPAPTPVEMRHEMKDMPLAPTLSAPPLLAESTDEAVSIEVDGCTYELDLENNTATLRWGSRNSEVVIPAEVEYEGQKFMVTAIGDQAFASRGSLVSVELPSSGTIKTIGVWAFSSCRNLERVSLPESLRLIDGLAFQDCSSLNNVSLPDGLQIIDVGAFEGCSSLTEVSIPASVDSIGISAFEGCSNMSTFIVDEANSHYCSVDGALLSKDGTLLLQIPCVREGKYTIPATVTTIEKNCGVGCRLTDLVIPCPVTTIGPNAFSKSTLLQTVNLGASVTAIGGDVFKSCPMLSNIVVEEGNPAYSSADGVLFNVDKTVLLMMPAQREGTYNVPATVKTIGNSAFYATALSEILLPESVETIEDQAFASAKNITGMVLPKSVCELGESAFSSCENLKSISLSENLGTINSYVFSGCIALESVDIPDFVTSIFHSTFSGCSSLKSVRLGASLDYIGSSTFERCSSLTEIEIPASVSFISRYAFRNCKLLAELKIHSNTLLGASAFSECTNLLDIYIYENGWSDEDVYDRETMFPKNVYTDATLHVPVGMEDVFSSVAYWHWFKNIVGDLPSSINALPIADGELRVEARADGAGVQVCAGNGGGNVGYTLYAVGGQRVGSGAFVADGGWHTLKVGLLAAGAYVLKVDCCGTVKSHKFIVK